ncbi:MAG: hypothetical protein ACYCY0_10175 [Acidithiobacillus ferrivorans]
MAVKRKCDPLRAPSDWKLFWRDRSKRFGAESGRSDDARATGAAHLQQPGTAVQGQVEAQERVLAEWRSRMAPIVGTVGD